MAVSGLPVARIILLAVDPMLGAALRRAVEVRVDAEDTEIAIVTGTLGDAIDAARREHGGIPLGLATRTGEQALGAIELGADEALVCATDDPGPLHDLLDRTTLRGSLRAESESMKLTYAHREKLAALGTLVAGVAHEINNPLAVVSLSVEMLGPQIAAAGEAIGALRAAAQERRGLAAEEVEKLAAIASPFGRRTDVATLVEDTVAAASAIRDVVADLRVFARAEDDEQAEVVRIPELVDQVLRLVGMQLESGAMLERDYPDDIPAVVVPRNRLAQVLTNVLVNAAHAIREVRRERHRVRVSVRADEDGVAISVSDTGPGIPAEAIERVFDPFYTTKRASLGTGLGLSLSRNIMRRMGGDLLLDSVYGDGATFVVLLPRADAAQLRDAWSRSKVMPSIPATRARQAVLVVDEDERVLRTHSRLLARHYDLLLASDEREAIDMLASGSQAHVLLVDPGVSALGESELCAWVSEHRPALAPRIVVVSAHAPSMRTEGAGVGEILPKPASAAQLLDAIERASRR